QSYNVVSAHPDWTDWVEAKWNVVATLFKAVFDAYGQNWAAAAGEAYSAIKGLYESADNNYSRQNEVTFPQNGTLIGDTPGSADEVRITFQASSGDDLKQDQCFAKFVPPTGIKDLGESRPSRFVYLHTLSLPLSDMVPGRYVLAFGAADSGTAN